MATGLGLLATWVQGSSVFQGANLNPDGGRFPSIILISPRFFYFFFFLAKLHLN